MPLTIGSQLGSHEITALLGKGGMGEVYRARDLKLKREVAIKILPEEFSRDVDRVSRFQREAEVLASLNHPNIAAIYDVQEANGSRFLVLELVEGETLTVRQRADPWNKIGSPKSKAAQRTIPLAPYVLNALREWKLACPKGQLGLVFPNGIGNVESHANIINRALIPVQIAAGVCTIVKAVDGKVVLDDEGEPVRQAKYTGLHALRHFYASWCINRKVDGGLELPGKVVQERLGHSSITMTMDTYGHLFPRADDRADANDTSAADPADAPDAPESTNAAPGPTSGSTTNG